MNICIDESGTFVYTTAQESWNCVTAYAYPEVSRRGIVDLMTQFKGRAGASRNSEIKLRDVEEEDYKWLLANLNRLDGVLYAVATDASMNTLEVLTNHQSDQVNRILAPVHLMQYESGRQAVRDLADQVAQLPLQLYVQMISQVQLVLAIINSAVIYYVQRNPPTLSKFRWRIDQKNSEKTKYEEAFSRVLPAFLQTASFEEPMTMLEGANYSWFNRFYFPEGEEPTYLQDTYGIESGDPDDRRLNIGQIVGEDVAFVDSKSSVGVQIADLLASGLRRCLRNGFNRNDEVAGLMGNLMVQNVGNKVPVQLISFGEEDREMGDEVQRTVMLMTKNARGMLAL